MQTSNFDYDLPSELIAQEPTKARDEARLLILRRSSGKIEHSVFRRLPDFLDPSDVLVLNETRVIPARLAGKDTKSGRELEFLLLYSRGEGIWRTLARPARKVRIGRTYDFSGGDLKGTCVGEESGGSRDIKFSSTGDFRQILEEIGEVPLPPYIKRKTGQELQLDDRERYQTVYARVEGSVAAPTAGLHFTPRVFRSLEEAGIQTIRIVLHVGPGTFRPIRSDSLDDHCVDAEYYQIEPEVAEELKGVREAGRRLVAVGTSTVRALETWVRREGTEESLCGWTELFLRPGSKFEAVGGLITNFHPPCSGPLVLAAAFADRQLILKSYREAIKERYRFYTYGDSMLIL